MPRGNCVKCSLLLSRLRIYRADADMAAEIGVQTWCRICGDPQLLFIPTDYIWAVDYCQDINEEATYHTQHYETGGWGVALRLDEVLELVFPRHHLGNGSTPHWPKPIEYTYSKGEEFKVNVVSEVGGREISFARVPAL